MFVVSGAIGNVSVVVEMGIRVVQEVVVELLPGMFDKGDGYIAEGW